MFPPARGRGRRDPGLSSPGPGPSPVPAAMGFSGQALQTEYRFPLENNFPEYCDELHGSLACIPLQCIYDKNIPVPGRRGRFHNLEARRTRKGYPRQRRRHARVGCGRGFWQADGADSKCRVGSLQFCTIGKLPIYSSGNGHRRAGGNHRRSASCRRYPGGNYRYPARQRRRGSTGNRHRLQKPP